MTNFISAIIDFIHPSTTSEDLWLDSGHNSKPPYWVTQHGERIHITILKDVHVDRIISWLDMLNERIAGIKTGFPVTYSAEHSKVEMWKKLLEDEMQRRIKAGIHND